MQLERINFTKIFLSPFLSPSTGHRGFKRVRSDPHYPQANGLAVSAVKIVKTTLDKHGGNYKKFNEALMLCHNVPNKSGTTLAQMFFGHEQRTLLPMLPGQYDFQIKNQSKVQAKERKSGLKNMRNAKVNHFHHSMLVKE